MRFSYRRPSNEHSQQQSSKTVITAATAMNTASNKAAKLWLLPPQQRNSQQQSSKTVITAAPAMKQPAKQ